MALIIDHPEAEMLAADLAQRTGQTVNDAVITALRYRFLSLRSDRACYSFEEKLTDNV